MFETSTSSERNKKETHWVSAPPSYKNILEELLALSAFRLVAGQYLLSLFG
jgi:hypothetical protein